MKTYDTIIIGGGQSGLSVAYYIKRYNIDYLILDDQAKPGGAWLNTWDSLKLFSPKEYSSLPGWQMQTTKEEYPTKDEFINYLTKYQSRYSFPIKRNVMVDNVFKEGDLFKIVTNKETYYTKTIVSSTGSAKTPFIPYYKNQHLFEGKQLHSVNYKNVIDYNNKIVLIVGGGNSGAQILAEISKVTNTIWTTKTRPHFLPDGVDGRYLFNEATQMFNLNGNEKKLDSLTDIVMIESVKNARLRGVLESRGKFKSFYNNGIIWENGRKEKIDIIIWCTGFKANLKHLNSLNIIDNNKIETNNTNSIKEPKIWLVGYGEWTGFASATIYGVGKTAKKTASEINSYINKIL